MKENQEFNKLLYNFFKTTKRQSVIVKFSYFLDFIVMGGLLLWGIIPFYIEDSGINMESIGISSEVLNISIVILMFLFLGVQFFTLLYLLKIHALPKNIKAYNMLTKIEFTPYKKRFLIFNIYLFEKNNWTIEKLSKFFTKYNIYNKVSQAQSGEYCISITIDKVTYHIYSNKLESVINTKNEKALWDLIDKVLKSEQGISNHKSFKNVSQDIQILEKIKESQERNQKQIKLANKQKNKINKLMKHNQIKI